jgi:trk system potassium uptake protein TrkH
VPRRDASTPITSLKSRVLHPARLIVLLYLAATTLGTILLLLPVATVEAGRTSFLTALFTAVSAISITGLTVVDTGSHWSAFGQVVVIALVQLGGFGITTLTSLFTILIFRKIGLRSRMVTETERGDLLRQIALFTVIVEATGLALLTLGFRLGDQERVGSAAWQGLFHSISAFNNGGFSTFDDSLVGLSREPFLLAVIGALVIVGGIGFPVVLDLVRMPRSPRRWSMNTKLTLVATGSLLVLGAGLVLAFEWTNAGTIGSLPAPDRVVNAAFGSITPRTAGFNTFDYGLATEPTLLVTSVLMLIGGGAASSAGGIKVTTFALLAFVIWAEVRGDPDVNLFGRRVSERTQRQALALALTVVGVAGGATLALLAMTDVGLGPATFEVLSALGTVGLSTGLTADLPTAGKVLLVALMLLGRLGALTVGTALVLRARERLYRYPEGRPIIG